MVWWVTWEVRQFSVVVVQRSTHIAMYVCVCLRILYLYIITDVHT